MATRRLAYRSAYRGANAVALKRIARNKGLLLWREAVGFDVIVLTTAIFALLRRRWRRLVAAPSDVAPQLLPTPMPAGPRASAQLGGLYLQELSQVNFAWHNPIPAAAFAASPFAITGNSP